jgi:hypothetical protein
MTIAGDDVRTVNTRYAERAATDAALGLARLRFGVTGGRREAVWRARSDGIVELVRAYDAGVELFEVFGDGTVQRVASSSRSVRKRIAGVMAGAGLACFFIAFPLSFLVSTSFMGLVMVWPALALAAALVSGRSHVRPWVESRFGSDADWHNVPWRIEGNPTTGSQVIALSAEMGDRNDTRYRILPSGRLEVAARGNKGELLEIDLHGVVTARAPRRGMKLKDIRGPDATWHRVYRSDPDE